MYDILRSVPYVVTFIFKYCEFSLIIIGIVLGKKMITKTNLEIKLLKQKLALIYQKQQKNDNETKE